jgi:hypothetical protein
MRSLSLLAVLVLTTSWAAGCKPSMIPGTSIEDSDENRSILEFLGKYRRAVIEKNVDGVTGLCAPDYFEDNGTVDQTDDYGLDKLRERLKTDFSLTKEIQLEIVVQKIIPPNDDDDPAKRAYKVLYHYSTRALVSPKLADQKNSEDKWITVSDVNQVVLRPDPAAGYLIVSGL